MARDIRQSTTAGDEPETNGCVEGELGIMRGEARSILKSSRLPTTYWPLAIRAASESRFRSQLRGMGIPVAQPLPFGLKAYAHQKRWHRTSNWQSPKQLVTLLGPAAYMAMTSGGYYAELPNGRCILTTAVIVPTSSKSTQQRMESVADLGNQNQEAGHEGEACFEENLLDEEPLLPPSSPEILHDAITEVEVEPMQTAGLGERQRFPKTTGLTHRLHGKQTILHNEVAIPTVASLALRARGESEVAVAMKEGFLCDQWQQDLVWMLFQHQALSQVCQELVLDIQEGIERSWMGKVLEKAQSEVKVLEGRLKALQGVEQEQQEATAQVLQTKTVSMAEVKEHYKEWTEPFQEEYQTLIKTVIKPLSASQAREEIGTATKVQRVPGKLVATIKPPSKKRGRIVACGNYADQATSQTSASGLDTICIRAMVRVAADRRWSLTSTDVRQAFLNAPRVEKEGHLTLVDPPKLLQTMGITTRRLREDQWMKPTSWTMDYLWVGFTIFEIEKEEAPTTPLPSQAASSTRPTDPTTEGQVRAGERDDLSSRSLSYAPVVQNTSHGPILNVTVNLHGISSPVEVHHSTMTTADTAESDLDDYELVLEESNHDQH